ncbi:MAG TPA: LUD domain-containing protein, partial [bacterium]|nr:LUD domain-containing protein [bacterium]
RARGIKEKAIEDLPDLLHQLENTVTTRGGAFFLARTAEEACLYAMRICKEAEARLVTKSKSMTTEEIHLNDALEKAGMEVVETDLGEMILQLAGDHPSHLVGPAIHQTQERIADLFRRVFNTDQVFDSGEALTKFARDRLREKFIRADVGITGANLITADTGTLLLVESEGNIRKVLQAPPVQIAIAGVEKVIPARKDLGVFIELLAASGTGQPLTTYTNVISPPPDLPVFSFTKESSAERKRQFHLILVDNGRMRMRRDPELRQALYCIRCGACLNSCANFQAVGGHAFGGETYTGGIGGAWEAGVGVLENAGFNDLCTGCSRCVPQCPVRINIPRLNTVLRNRLNQTKAQTSFQFPLQRFFPSAGPDRTAPLEKQFFGNYHLLAKWGSSLASVSNWIIRVPGVRKIFEKVIGLDRRRTLPVFTRDTLQRRARHWRKSKRTPVPSERREGPVGRAILFADTYSNYLHPGWGIAALEVFTSLGIELQVSEVYPDGRAALSQGMIATAASRGQQTTKYLEQFVRQGLDILVLEPSVLALFRSDYQQLLEDPDLFGMLRSHTYDPMEYLEQLISGRNLDIDDYFDRQRIRNEEIPVFFHSHCQQRTLGTHEPTERLLGALGFQVILSMVECCGMAGSFGYKKEFYDVSRRVGEDLFSHISRTEAAVPDLLIVASGMSCTEQIGEGMHKHVFHPMEILARYLR